MGHKCIGHAYLNNIIIYKLWTGCLTSLLTQHCEQHRIIYPVQKGCSRGQHGCTDDFLSTNSVWHQVKSKCRSLAVAWIDYKKPKTRCLTTGSWSAYVYLSFRVPTLMSCLERLLPILRSKLFLQLPDSNVVHLSERLRYRTGNYSKS